ncbi:hypothetical protein C8F01DRAFT_1319594 [Mycena amicta]|nr:hypothetical protein C8F01DRAFT_1319594 [Mycena amicta]
MRLGDEDPDTAAEDERKFIRSLGKKITCVCFLWIPDDEAVFEAVLDDEYNPLERSPMTRRLRTNILASLLQTQTDLLSAIRDALRGAPSEPPEARRANFVSTLPNAIRTEPLEEEEVSWNSSVVVWSSGGIIRKTWMFMHEGEDAQTATIGWLEQSTPEYAASSTTSPSSSATSERPTFVLGKSLKNGLDYTFSLPFIVRKAWPLYPHGIMIQRNIEREELEEAALAGEPLLPTIFSLTSPFAEPGYRWGDIWHRYSSAPWAYACRSSLSVLVNSYEQANIHHAVQLRPPATAITKIGSRYDAYDARAACLAVRHASFIFPSRYGTNPLNNHYHGFDWLRPHRNSLTRNDLSVTMDRMALGGCPESDSSLVPVEHARTKTSYWVEKLVTRDLSNEDSARWQSMTCALFDGRGSGTSEPSLLSIHLPASEKPIIFELAAQDDALEVKHVWDVPALAAVALRITRPNVWDLLVLKPDHQLVVLTHGMRELPIQLQVKDSHPTTTMHVDPPPSTIRREYRLCLDLPPTDLLVNQTLQILALMIPGDVFFELHQTFLLLAQRTPASGWQLAKSPSHCRFREDPALRHLKTPNCAPDTIVLDLKTARHPQRKTLLAPILYAMHSTAEDLRLRIDHYKDLCRLVPVICRIALVVRMGWADYWKCLCPDAMTGWPHPSTEDVSAILYGRISNPEWPVLWHDAQHTSDLVFSLAWPFPSLPQLTSSSRSLFFVRRSPSHWMILLDGGCQPLGVEQPHCEDLRGPEKLAILAHLNQVNACQPFPAESMLS